MPQLIPSYRAVFLTSPKRLKNCALCDFSYPTLDSLRRCLRVANSLSTAILFSTSRTVAFNATIGSIRLWFRTLHRHLLLALTSNHPNLFATVIDFNPAPAADYQLSPFSQSAHRNLQLRHALRLLSFASACPTSTPTYPLKPRQAASRPRPRRLEPDASSASVCLHPAPYQSGLRFYVPHNRTPQPACDHHLERPTHLLREQSVAC